MKKPKYFDFQIITPHQVYREQAVQVIAPGRRGLFGVLVNHAPAVVQLKIGRVDVRAVGGDKLYTISGGVAEIRDNVMKIMTESAEDVETIDVKRAERARDRALERLSSRHEYIDEQRARAALARALNRLETAKYRY